MGIRVGLVGTGVMGAQHARLLATGLAGCELVAIADVDVERTRRIAEELGVPRTYSEGISLIRAPGVDAVLIASSDETHFDLTAECIRTGKPVLCEKPLAPTSEQCRQLIDAEIRRGKRLVQVGFMRRFDPGYLDMKAAIDGRMYGAPIFFHCIHRIASAPHYFTTRTIPIGSAVHEFDIARFLLGEDFTRITVRAARASSRAPHRRPLLFLLESVSGVLTDIEVFTDDGYGYDVRAELVLEGAAFSLADPAVSTFKAGGVSGSGIDQDWSRRFETAYRQQAEEWLSSLATGTPIGASAWDGYLATKTAEESLRAFDEDQDRMLTIEHRPEFYA